MGTVVFLSVSVACAIGAAGCFQKLDESAANGVSGSTSDIHRRAADGGSARGEPCSPACPNDRFCQGGQCLPIDTTTPPIELDDGTTTNDACFAMKMQSLEIRQRYCASCHAPPAKLGGLDCVLDDAKLLTAVSSSVLDADGKPVRLIVPGDPQGSRFYTRIAHAEMPPVQSPPLPALPAPTVSDLSVLEAWIARCTGGPK